MSIRERVASLVGLAGDRDGAPPAYRLIAPGLIVTDESAWAWYVIQTTNSDLDGEAARDREQDEADRAWRLLRGREWDLRGMWGTISGDEYLAGLDLDAATPDGEGPLLPLDDPAAQAVREYAAERADDLDHAELRTKVRLLGVKLTTRNAGTSKSALGLDDRRVPLEEQKQLLAAARQLGQQLRGTIWRCRLASVETLAWTIGRELHRDVQLPIPPDAGPRANTIEGPELHRLSAGRMVPQTDHLLFMTADNRIAAYGAVLALTDFPEEVVTPGQEWLAVLNGLQTEAAGNEAGEPVDVLAEERIRGRNPSAKQANKTVQDARKSAKEQRTSAEKSSAGEADDAIAEAEDEAREIALALRRRQTMLVHDHPRISLSAETRSELNAKVEAVIAAYEGMGITATLCADEQRELWLESLPCDRVRVPDLGHWRAVAALSASWFWGGSAVGSTDRKIPCIGYTTGSTVGLVRFLATESTDKSDAPVTVFTGRTRRGKTTAMQLAVLDVMLSRTNYGRQPWVAMLDTKGDAGGILLAAQMLGINSSQVRIDDGQGAHGQLDGFLTADPEHAEEIVADQLKLLTPAGELLQKTVHYITTAVSDVAKAPQPRAWKVVERLNAMAAEDDAERALDSLAKTLTAVTRRGWGALVAGKPADGTELKDLPTDSGITLVTVPGLFQNLPDSETERDQWDDRQRAAVAVLRALIAWCTNVAASVALRDRPKMVAIPEVHTLTATKDGRSFLTQQARMGAAADLSLVLDTQDVSGIRSMVGLAESISAVFGFAQMTNAEQVELARMVGLSEEQGTLETIANLDQPTDEDLEETGGEQAEAVRRGHCIYLDRTGRAATVQWRLPSLELQEVLDTSAAAQSARRDDEQRREKVRAQMNRDEELDNAS